MTLAKTAILAAIGAVALTLGACAESRMHLSDDFGAAVKQDKLAQIADPDAKYTGNPAAGSNGPRMADAVDRYVNGKVIKPVTSRTASIPTGGGGGGGGGSQ